MAMFHLDTAFMLEAIGFAAGLALLHFGRAGSAVLLRAAGWVLVATAVATAACSSYFAVRYHVQGEFDHAYPMPMGCSMGGQGGMHGMDGMPGMPGMHGMHGMPKMGGAGMMHRASPPAADGATGAQTDEAAPPAVMEGESSARP